MNKQNVTQFFKGIGSAVSKHKPEILIGLGVGSMITSTILAVKATPKALKRIEEKKEEERVDKLMPIETVKAAWKPYIPAVISGVTGVACIIGANSTHMQRNAALATAYKLSETALAEYKEKVVETIGEKKEQSIREKIAQDRLNDKQKVDTTPIYVVDTNSTEFYDPIGGARFVTTIDKVKAAINEVNAILLDNDFVSMNDFYYELGLPPTKMGYDLGWNTTKGRRESLIHIHFTSQFENGKAYAVLEYDVAPRYDYEKFFG